MRGFAAYLRFEVARTLRNPAYIMFTLGFPLAFYLLFTSLYGSQASAGGFDFNSFYMVSMAAYGAFGAAIQANSTRLSMERSGGWVRQLRVTPLAPLPYVLAKAAMALAVAGPALALVSLAGVLFHGVQMPATAWVAYLLSMWLGVIPFAVLGVLLGYLFDSQSAGGAVMVIYFALSILGGMWFPPQVMPKVMRAIAHLMPSYHYVELGWNAVADHALGWGHIAVLLGYTAVFALLAMWRYRRDEAKEYA
jgi:ABC-2 type transport system permease protein